MKNRVRDPSWFVQLDVRRHELPLLRLQTKFDVGKYGANVEACALFPKIGRLHGRLALGRCYRLRSVPSTTEPRAGRENFRRG